MTDLDRQQAAVNFINRTRAILAEALKLHDAEGCTCDRRYIMSCPNMAQAILKQGKNGDQAR